VGDHDVAGTAGDRAAAPRTRPLKVATLLSFPLGPGTGLGVFLLGLNEALQRNPGLELVLIAPESVRGAAGRRGSQTRLAFEQMRELRRTSPDVIHTHDHPALLAAAVAYRLLVKRSVRVVYTAHLDWVEPRALWKRAMLGWLLARCAAVTVVAQNTAGKLHLVATPVPGPDVVRVVPGAATVRIRDRSDPAVVAFGAGIGHVAGPVILQVSNFWFPAKVEGSVRLMEAMVTVRRRFPSVRLIMLGTGPLLNTVKAARERLGLCDTVTLPAMFIEDLSLPVGLSDIHCHISLQDACPISILEAMHAGKPVIASRTGGIPELITDGLHGILVDDNPQRIAAAIIDLLEHPDKAKAMGLQAQRLAQSRFTWERVAGDFESLYGAVPSRSPQATPAELCDVVK
jgi:glycosyltransferase involved in cell wall biosynthesis